MKKNTKIEDKKSSDILNETKELAINLTEEEKKALGGLVNEMNHYQMIMGKFVLDVLRGAQLFGQRDAKLTELVNDKIALSGLTDVKFKDLNLQTGKILLDKVERKSLDS